MPGAVRPKRGVRVLPTTCKHGETTDLLYNGGRSLPRGKPVSTDLLYNGGSWTVTP